MELVLKFTSHSDPNIFTCHRSLGLIILDKVLAYKIQECGRKGEPGPTQMLLLWPLSLALQGPDLGR